MYTQNAIRRLARVLNFETLISHIIRRKKYLEYVFKYISKNEFRMFINRII